MSSWNDVELRRLFLTNTPLIDVRAPIEFKEGKIPNSINIPIMNDEERSLVGTLYKQAGQAAAIELGHQLVCGKVKENRICEWMDYIEKNPSAELFCYRGGLRSQTVCSWLKGMGIFKSPLTGGYKRIRSFFLSILDEAPKPDIIRVAGPTGSGKTHFLKTFSAIIDLEELANHRGSAFGSLGQQPTQVTFENNLAKELLFKEGKTILVEDESATIGKISIPRRFFQDFRNSPVIILKVELEERIRNIYTDYVCTGSAQDFLNSLEKIQKSLGGLTYKIIRDEMQSAFKNGPELKHHETWIGMLLKLYYDPLYYRDLKRQPGLVLMEGNISEVRTFINNRGIF